MSVQIGGRYCLWIYLRGPNGYFSGRGRITRSLRRAYRHPLGSEVTGLSDGAELQQSRIAVPVSGAPERRRVHERIDQLHDRNPLRAVRPAGRDRARAEEEAVREAAGARRETAAAAPRHVSLRSSRLGLGSESVLLVASFGSLSNLNQIIRAGVLLEENIQ